MNLEQALSKKREPFPEIVGEKNIMNYFLIEEFVYHNFSDNPGRYKFGFQGAKLVNQQFETFTFVNYGKGKGN